jgi:NADH:ubiquinone oxidoreductase subunit H
VYVCVWSLLALVLFVSFRLLLFSMRRRKLGHCAQQEVGGSVVLPFEHCTLVYFGLFSSLNLMMRSAFKKKIAPSTKQRVHTKW